MELGVRSPLLRARGRRDHERRTLAARHCGAERCPATDRRVVRLGGDDGREGRGRWGWVSADSSVATAPKRGRSARAPVGRRDGDGVESGDDWGRGFAVMQMYDEVQ